MAQVKIYNGSTFVLIDANNLETVDGIHLRIYLSKLQYSLNGVDWVNAT